LTRPVRRNRLIVRRPFRSGAGRSTSRVPGVGRGGAEPSAG
jgi:hypothetical protein